MSKNKTTLGRILVVMTVAFLLAGSAYGQEFGNANRNTLSSVFPGMGYGGVMGPMSGSNRDSQGMDNLVGAMIGSFLGYMIESNQNGDRNYYYSDRDWNGDRDWDRDRDRNRDRDRRGATDDRYSRNYRNYDYRLDSGYRPYGR